MANFIGMVFATLKDNGINTSGMSTDEAVKKYNELKNKDLTPAEKDRLDDMDKGESKNNADEIAKLKDELAHTSMFAPGNKRQELKDRIGMLEGGYSSMQEYKKAQEEKEMQRLREIEKRRYEREQGLKRLNAEKKRNIKVNEVKKDEMPPVKNGYVRLFRGLETEFNPNYNKQTDDNPTSYESWTDSYDLAKAYGKNVIFMDVPKNTIAKEVMDKDGDRNYIYKHDKPVGLKGKSGAEFLLYKDHEKYDNAEITKIK